MKLLPILCLVVASGFGADRPTTAPVPTAATSALTPTPPPAPLGPVLRMFPLKYADADQIRKLFSNFSYPITTNHDFNVLAVTAPVSFLDKVDLILKQFDVAPIPPKNVELTVYLMAGADAPSTTPLPKELQEMEKHLIETSSFKAYRLADIQVIRARSGQPAGLSGALELSQVRFRAAKINKDQKGNIISIDDLHVQLKSTAIDVDIDLREGELVVIGKPSPGGLLLAVAKVPE